MIAKTQYQHETHRCNSVGWILVAGRKVGMLRCELDAGHNVGAFPRDVTPVEELGHVMRVQLEPTPHRASLEWDDEAALAESWPEALDPDETYDVDVPTEPAGEWNSELGGFNGSPLP